MPVNCELEPEALEQQIAVAKVKVIKLSQVWNNLYYNILINIGYEPSKLLFLCWKLNFNNHHRQPES